MPDPDERADKAANHLGEERVSLDSALAADELFITNSGIGVLPVTRINYDVLATGSPGPVTRRLAKAYLKTVDGEVGSC